MAKLSCEKADVEKRLRLAEAQLQARESVWLELKVYFSPVIFDITERF
jgi:hypothetical protein